MAGDKPDPRLRTPMQWNAGPGLGFTSGTAWESAQPDSLTTNVALQDADAGSLLNLYRRLIRLRKQTDALATGRLVPVTASGAQVAAYLRRAGNHSVLVVANLGATAVSRLSIASGYSVLPVGTYSARNLLDGRPATALQVSRDGRIRGYAPLTGTLGPRQSLILDLHQR